MVLNLKDLEARLGVESLDAFTEAQIRPLLETLDQETSGDAHAKALKSLQTAFTIGFAVFGVCFFGLVLSFPDDWYFVIMKFVLFPILFFGIVIGVAWLKRGTILKIILRTEGHFVTRAQVLQRISETLGLAYVPAPGGAPSSLKLMAKWKLMPADISKLVEVLDGHGGQDETVAIAQESGLINPHISVLGRDEDRAKYYKQMSDDQTFEDGFEGVVDGIRFSALEWVEKVEDQDDRYHLVVVLDAPRPLHGVTQLRSRQYPWPQLLENPSMHPVELLPESFNQHFRLRGSDQVEARTIFNPAVVERVLAVSHGKPFRAVAMKQHLVIDVVGVNRFAVVDLTTGNWNDDTIRQTYTDIAELLELVREMAHAFMVAP